MNGKILLLASAAIVSGCATSKNTYLPDGRQGYSINCSGGALSWDLCYNKAGELCGGAGYDVIVKTGDQGAVVGGSPAGVFGGSVITRSLLIGCKTKKSG